MEVIDLSTSRLRIRNLRLSDLEHFHAYRSNPEVTRYQGFDVMDKTQAADFILLQQDKLYGEPGQWVQYAIENVAAAELIGDCAIKLDGYDPRIAEIGITISHLHQRQGYAKETMEAILAFLFGRQELHRVAETVDAENTASIRLLESTGFRREGYFIENIFFKGQWGSEYKYAMLRREWLARNTAEITKAG